MGILGKKRGKKGEVQAALSGRIGHVLTGIVFAKGMSLDEVLGQLIVGDPLEQMFSARLLAHRQIKRRGA